MKKQCDIITDEHHHGKVTSKGNVRFLCTYHRIKFGRAADATKKKHKIKYKNCRECRKLFKQRNRK